MRSSVDCRSNRAAAPAFAVPRLPHRFRISTFPPSAVQSFPRPVRCLKLPFEFDPGRLRSDLARVAPSEWIPHVNRRHYDGEWSGAALRSIGGVAENIVPDAPDISAFRDTALLDRCSYYREVLATFQCPLQAVRLLRLHAGSNIAEHVDHALDFDDGEVRIHVPMVTNDEVKFYLDGSRLVMAPGECWYTNVNLPHSVENRSATDRIHLVIDCQVNAWLRELFANTPKPAIDHYAARLALPRLPGPSEIMSVLSDYAANAAGQPRFRVDQATLIVQWPEEHAWQVRLKPESQAERWSAWLETSPDPERRHRADVAALLRTLASAFPGITVEQVGLG